MASQKFETMSDTDLNVAAEANYAGLFSVGGGFGMDSSQRKAASDFLESVETKAITVGAAPPASGDAMTWASTVKDSPVPTSYKLSPIENLFTGNYIDKSKFVVNLTAISKNIKDYKKEYCEHLMMKGEVESCEELSPGMVLENTRFYNEYASEAYSYKQCIDYCLKYRQCIAITYCVNCKSTDTQYRVCYLYQNRDQGQSAKSEESGWNSILFVGKMKQEFKLVDTEVIGRQRGFDKEEDKSANASKCYDLCLKDAHCVTFSYCECPDVEIKCKLFSFEGVLGFEKEVGTSSYFLPKYLKASAVRSATTHWRQK